MRLTTTTITNFGMTNNPKQGIPCRIKSKHEPRNEMKHAPARASTRQKTHPHSLIPCAKLAFLESLPAKSYTFKHFNCLAKLIIMGVFSDTNRSTASAMPNTLAQRNIC